MLEWNDRRTKFWELWWGRSVKKHFMPNTLSNNNSWTPKDFETAWNLWYALGNHGGNNIQLWPKPRIWLTYLLPLTKEEISFSFSSCLFSYALALVSQLHTTWDGVEYKWEPTVNRPCSYGNTATPRHVGKAPSLLRRMAVHYRQCLETKTQKLVANRKF